ncbi:MAG: hypothetical protein QOF89_4754 [Acidobacteriota bacterium]|jgi:hypothetical protein|nr:hypothetical protein [Acidobacteriota bacterium]
MKHFVSGRVSILMGFLLASRLAGAAATPLVPQARLQPADLTPGDGFGNEAVLSADGGTALLPARFQDCAAAVDCGAVYVFARQGGTWIQQTKLTPPGAAAHDQFASAAVSADGNVALIGDYSRDCGLGSGCGAAFVFERSGGVWGAGVPLDSPSPQVLGRYGSSVGLSGAGDVAVVGAISESGTGVAHVFRRTGGAWSLETTLHPDLLAPNNFFGSSIQVSRDGKTVLARGDVFGGANAGAVYVFRETGGTWSQEAKILPPVLTIFEFFPVALSGDGQTAIIAHDQAYFVYVRNAGLWTQQVPALPGNGGAALSFDGGTVIVGSGGGTAQLLARNGSVWSLLQVLIPTEPGAASSGTSVALSGDARTALVGLPGVDCAAGCRGAAFIFAEDVPLAAVPTLSELGLALLALLIAGTGAVLLRRRQRV